MNSIVHKQTLYVNSANRLDESVSSTNFLYRLDIDNNKEYDKVSLIDLVVPKSFYNISSSNNTITVEENSIQRTITMPVGNYSRKSFRTVLQTQLNSNAESGYSYTISYDQSSSGQDNGKYTFVCTSVSPQPIVIIGTGCYEQLGFDKNSTNTFVADILISSNVVNFRAKTRLIFKSSMSQNYNNNILHYITSIDADFDYVNFQNDNIVETYKDYVRSNTNIYSFQLLDESFNAIDLNGLDISFSVLLWKENNISDLIKNYILMKTYKMKIKDS